MDRVDIVEGLDAVDQQAGAVDLMDVHLFLPLCARDGHLYFITEWSFTIAFVARIIDWSRGIPM